MQPDVEEVVERRVDRVAELLRDGLDIDAVVGIGYAVVEQVIVAVVGRADGLDEVIEFNVVELANVDGCLRYAARSICSWSQLSKEATTEPSGASVGRLTVSTCRS
jgi:hypothetical protein